VRHGKVQGGLHTLKVRSGEHVVITITNDANDQAHLHGIDKEVELTANTPAKLAFDAKAQGSYELELHGSETLIATVEVR
jgi:FtsP/CotA-like multicopper oxidase with cupredoxin domain